MTQAFDISQWGDVVGPCGYHPELSEAVVSLLCGHKPDWREKPLKTLRDYLNHDFSPDRPLALIEESFDEATDRIKSFLRSRGYTVKPPNNSIDLDDFRIKVAKGASTKHLEQIVATLRKFYRELGNVELRSRANPTEVRDWDKWIDRERRAWWKARHPKLTYGYQHAGLRFRALRRETYPPLLHDATGCGIAMTLALRTLRGCPTSVLHIGMVLQDNGCRWREAALSNALGWALRGFGEHVGTTNKHDADPMAKTISLPPEVLGELVRRMEASPHPGHPEDPERSMMEWLRELAAAKDWTALRAVALFPSSRGTPYTPSGFDYWFRRAMDEWVNEDGSKGLLIHSDIGTRRPTTHWYRHAVITHEIEKATVDCKSEAEIKDACRSVCASMGLKTDMSNRYAARLMKRLSEEMRLRNLEERRATIAQERAGVAVEPALPRLRMSEADSLIALFPSR